VVRPARAAQGKAARARPLPVAYARVESPDEAQFVNF
jgi:methyl-accepting chemotaxis protein